MYSLAKYRKRYLRIISTVVEGEQRDTLLAEIMTDMENECHIPLLAESMYVASNLDVMTLYRAVSDSRTSL